MIIKPSAAIRRNYDEISELCKRTMEPVFLTKNGEGDLVVMDLATYSRRESILKLQEQLFQSEVDIMTGNLHTVEDTTETLKRIII